MKVLTPSAKKDPGPASVMNTYLKSAKLPSIVTDIHQREAAARIAVMAAEEQEKAESKAKEDELAAREKALMDQRDEDNRKRDEENRRRIAEITKKEREEETKKLKVQHEEMITNISSILKENIESLRKQQ